MIKILIVDDNQNNRLTLELLLEDIENIEISEAEDGKKAVDLCKEKYFDLIFMDIMMPVMDGIDATKLIKEFSKSSMIIALSALDDTESKQKMLLAGAEDYLSKPVDSELFLQRVKNYCNIINLRKNNLDNKEAINPFTTVVYDRVIKFYIKDEDSLVQFWDFFLKANTFNCVNFSDYIRLIYGISLWLIKIGKSFTIEVEGNESNMFFMINKVSSIKKQILTKIIKKHIADAVFLIEEDRLSFKLLKVEAKDNIATDDETKNILSKMHLDNPTAAEFVENTAISIMPKIDSLEIIENELSDLLIKFELNPDKQSLELVCEKFDEYYGVVALLVEFEHLVFAIKSLIVFLRSIEEEKIKSTDLKTFVSQLLNLVNDLSSWREIIFIKQEAIDIHYLDASLLSSCLQLEATFEDKEVDEGDDLEFF